MADTHGDHGWWTRRHDRLLTVLGAALLLCWVAVVELAHLPLPYPSDQINYVDAAGDFPHPAAGTPVHQFTRFGLTLPIRATIEVFGYSLAAYYTVPVLTGLALALAVYLLGTMLVARSVGLAAGALAVTNTLVFHDVLAPLPDVLATALFCWAVVLALVIRRGHPLVATPRRQAVGLLVLGVLLGWSYLTREYIVFAWPVVVVLIARRVRWRGLLLVAGPLLATAVAELALCVLTYGDPLARVHAVTGHGSGPIDPALAATYQDMPRWWYLTRFAAGLWHVPEGGLLLVAVTATVVGGLVAPRRLGILLGWLAAVYVPLVLLGGLVDPGAPKLRLFLMRYWFPVFPAFIVGGFAVAWLVTRKVLPRLVRHDGLRRRAGAAASAVVVALGLLSLSAAQPSWARSNGYRVVGTDTLALARDWLAAHRDEVRVLWSDGRTVRLLPLYRTTTFGRPVWSGELRTLGAVPPATGAAAAGRSRPAPASHAAPASPGVGEFVLLYSTQGTNPCGHCRLAAEDVLGRPVRVPAGWHRVFATRDGSVLVFEVRDT